MASNGNSMTRTANDNDKLQYNARLMWQPNGSQVLNQRAWVTGALYSESDFESTTTPIYALAVNWENQNNFNATTGNDQKWNAFSFDGIFKFKGFSTVGMYTMAKRTRKRVPNSTHRASTFRRASSSAAAGSKSRCVTPSLTRPTWSPTTSRPRFAAPSATTTRATVSNGRTISAVRNAIGDLGPGGEGEGVAVATAVHFLGLLRGKSEVTDI